MLNCVARGGAVQAFENFGLPMNLIERFVRHAVAETTGTGAIVRYVPNLIWLVATRFLVRLLVPLDS
jgi:hypothetical protein